jgi:hypothetical protein
MNHRTSGLSGRVLTRRSLFGGAALVGGVLAAGATGLALPRRAYAAGSRVYDRAAWHARRPSKPVTVLNHGPDHIVVHHTASANSTDYSLDHALQLSRNIQDIHMDRRGWFDIGEQLTISRGGYVMEGRARSLETIKAGLLVEGAQTKSENDHTIGIENEGLYDKVKPPHALLDSLVGTMAWLCDTYGLDPHAAIVGHRDYNATDCPGELLYGMLPELRDRVAAAMGQRAESRTHQRLPHRDGPNPRSHRPYDHGPAFP